MLATALVGPAAVLAPTPAQAAPAAPTPGRLVGHRTHGAAAIKALGARLPEAARRNEMSAQHLADLLRSDGTAWVDTAGRVYFVDRAPARDTAQASTDTTGPSAAADVAPYPYDQTFALHSKPGSSRTIYLDFDGQLVTGTAWNEGGVDGTVAQPAFDTDGDPAVFSRHERAVVQEVWQRVADDYAPFDVDVTTADPGAAALVRSTDSDTTYGVRALITPSEQALTATCAGGCSGIAYVGSFDLVGSGDAYEPAWIFPQMTYTTAQIAETVSHEVGHNLGLEHDGGVTGDYYSGHNGWAPIMGSGNHPITQWSKGEYTGASNQQDDFAVIASHGAALRPDDHADTRTGATALATGDLLTGAGVITTATDKDTFAFSRTCTGPATIAATPAPPGPDLDIRLRLLGSNGTELAAVDPTSAEVDPEHASGMDAVWTGSLDLGTTYYLEVDGVGRGTADTGYTDYASVGAYSISVTGCGKPAAPTEVTLTKDPATSSATIAWQPPPAGGLPVTGYVVTRPDGSTVGVSSSTRSQAFTGLAPGASYTVGVAATTDAGTGSAVSRDFVNADVPPSAPAHVSVQPDDNTQYAGLTWDPPEVDGDAPVSGYEVTRSGLDTHGQPFTPTTVDPWTTSWGFSDLAYGTTYQLGVTAISSAGRSQQSVASVTLVQPRLPSAPRNQSASAGTEKATVSWSAPLDEGTEPVTAYRVTTYDDDDAKVGDQLSYADQPLTTTVTGLTAGTAYTFGIAAISQAGTGPEASTGSVTPRAPVAPTAPRAVTATPGDSSATVSWTPPSNSGSDLVTTYVVNVYDTQRLYVSGTQTDTTSVTVTGLDNGSTYTIGVQAVSDAGVSPEATSAPVTAGTPASAPQSISASAGDQQVKVTWAAPSSSGTFPVSGYRVRTYSSGGQLLRTSALLAASARASTVSGLVNGTAYRVAVRAVTAVGDGAEARSGLVTPVAPVAPSAPQSLTAKPGDRRVALSWSAPAAAGTSAVTQYAVKVYDGQGATVATYTQAASTRTRTVTGLVNGRSYRFGVRAVSAAGAGTEARTGLVRPVARPGAPRIGTAASGVTGGTVTAKAVWAAPLTNGGSAITGYRVTAYRISSTGAVVSQTTSSLRPASARSFSMTLRRGRYRFAVRAVNAIGTSAFSARSNLVTAR
ncbi:hypothetical protein GCM10009815_08810 [Nocardioides marmoribigeumensis]